jgi:hypothetical protein
MVKEIYIQQKEKEKAAKSAAKTVIVSDELTVNSKTVSKVA